MRRPNAGPAAAALACAAVLTTIVWGGIAFAASAANAARPTDVATDSRAMSWSRLVSMSSTVPSAGFAFSPAYPVVGQVVSFTDSSTSSPTSWAWSFGDGGTSTLKNPSHSYVATGTYTVALTASNASGSGTFSQSVIVGNGAARTVGLMMGNSRAFNGYTLFSPKQNKMTYLIDNQGRIVHEWQTSQYAPGQSCYLLPNGNLLRPCMVQGQLSTGGGEGGRVEEYDWDGNLIWQMNYSTDTYMQHHDVRMLPNGDVLMLVCEKKTYAEAIAAGFNPSEFQPDIAQNGYMVPDSVVEIKPTLPSGGTVVWQWHVWDHLIQSYDATKANYGDPKAHQELIDAAGDHRALPSFWNHMNSIAYNPALDEIALSVRGNSEVWIIDHSTTTSEAASHSGGRRGKGGDLLYRWGNPICYSAGTASAQKYFQQHDVEWVATDCPGAGDLTCFNNGLGRGNYSTVDEFAPAVDATGNYSMPATGTAFGPSSFTWSYVPDAANPMYSADISGAQRLPNGNTVICAGGTGQFREVTPSGEVVWKYVCPVDATGPITQGSLPPSDTTHPDETMNSVFRIYKYSVDYPAFTGRYLVPGDYVEKYAAVSAPVAAFTFSPSAPATAQVVQFTDASTGGPTSWAWDFGDGATGSLQNPTHAYSAAGVYNVALTARSSAGSTSVGRSVVVGSSSSVVEVQLPGGEFEMGDHYGFVDPDHPSDELPIHDVKISPLCMAVNDTTNEQFLAYLNDALAAGQITVRGNTVYAAGGTDPYYYTHQYSGAYSIGFDGTTFSIMDFRADHPAVGVSWCGGAAYCNWLSQQHGLQPCYNLSTWVCDFTKNGYRLPTEAEWEYAARGGQDNPYYNYPWGNDLDTTKANWPDSGDPYEGTTTSTYPWTTPVGFYDGSLRLKSAYNWPGGASSYQTSNSTNGFGLHDMAGNVWQFVNDWYQTNYYSVSPSSDPRGPDTGTPMPDGVAYRGMRGGCWYNGEIVNGVNNGHSRVSNRDPSYYRGPLDPAMTWCVVGFRVARNATAVTTFTLSYRAGANGSVVGSSTQVVTSGASGTPVTAVADLGHHFVNWSDGRTENPRTDTNVTASVSATANFAVDAVATCTLSYSASANGSIVGSATQVVNSGGSGTAVTAAPNSGYHFVDWSDGSTANPRADASVTANISVTANFSANVKSPTSLTIATSATSVTRGKQFILLGLMNPTPGAVGAMVHVDVRKPGRSYYSYSSNRLVYAGPGGKAAWQYKYNSLTTQAKGTYVFHVVFDGNGTYLAVTSVTKSVTFR